MQVSLKESCSINLGFPYHKHKTPAESLSRLSSFLNEKKKVDSEFGNDHGANLLEDKVAKLFGMQAALWLPTGTLAQGIAARIHGQQINSERLLLHPSSHLLLHEEQGYQYAHGCSATVIGKWRETLTSGDISGESGSVFIELPQRHSGGKLPSWNELQGIKDHCKTLGMPLHMDGARLWSCRPFYENRSYADIAAGFDSVYVSLYKDIGSMGGALLAGSQVFIDDARKWRTRLGGFSVGSWPLIYDALDVIDNRIEQMPAFIEKAKQLATAIQHIDSFRIDPVIPHTNLFHILLNVSADKAASARDQVARDSGVWLSDRFWDYEYPNTCAMEFVVGEKALALENKIFTNAMSLFNKAFNPC
ncbi:MAG: threonine aldolase [Paraglaciecola sp.]|jgi:threonine aldolase